MQSFDIISLANLAISIGVVLFVVGIIIFTIIALIRMLTPLSKKEQDKKLADRMQWSSETASDWQRESKGRPVRIYRCLRCGVVGKDISCLQGDHRKEVETLYYSQKKFCSMFGHQYIDRAESSLNWDNKGRRYADVMRECKLCGYTTSFKKFYSYGRDGNEILMDITTIGLAGIIFIVLWPITILAILWILLVKAFDKEPQIHYRES